MRTFLIIITSLLIISGSVSCTAQKRLSDPLTSISKLSDVSGITEGSLVYTLPMTVLDIKIEMERLIEIPGPYSRYAGDLLGLNKVIMNQDENWSVKGISISYNAEADPSQIFIIESNTLFHTNMLVLKKEGLIMDLNPSAYPSDRTQNGAGQAESDYKGPFDLGADAYFRIQRDTAYQRVSVDSTFIRIPYLVEKKRKLTLDQLADMAARKLMELREGKFLILTGETNVFPQNEAALVELNRLEKEYTELFTGKSWRETKTVSLQFIPEREMSGKQVEIFRFSEKTGPLAGSDKTGVPLILELVPDQKTKGLSVITRQPAGSATTYDKMYYRVPDVVNLKISTNDETFYTSRRLIYQFGEIVQLPSNYIIGK